MRIEAWVMNGFLEEGSGILGFTHDNPVISG
jgi:hypothetical protein